MSATQPEVRPDEVEKKRLTGLDVFRGFVIASMLFVNVSWDRSVFPAWMFHRGWNEGVQGVSFTDLVFPWFLFIAGVSVPFSLASGRGRGVTRSKRLLAAAKRGLLIYACGGLLFAARTDKIQLLTWDILQLIGVAYFLCAVLSEFPRAVRVALVAAVLFAKWWILTRFVEPGESQNIWTPERNGERYLAGEWGLGWFAGFKQALPATALCLLGAESGRWIRACRGEPLRAVRGLLLGGSILTAAGLLWSLDMPFSKDFFSSSFVVFSAGTGTLLLGLCIAVFDGELVSRFSWVRSTGFVFTVYGRNAIALYLAAELSWRMVFTRWRVRGPSGEPQALINAWLSWLQHGLGEPLGAWLHASSWVLLGWLFCWALYRKRIFLRL